MIYNILLCFYVIKYEFWHIPLVQLEAYLKNYLQSRDKPGKEIS